MRFYMTKRNLLTEAYLQSTCENHEPGDKYIGDYAGEPMYNCANNKKHLDKEMIAVQIACNGCIMETLYKNECRNHGGKVCVPVGARKIIPVLQKSTLCHKK